MGKPKNVPPSRYTGHTEKRPATSVADPSADDRHPSWKLKRLAMSGPFSWADMSQEEFRTVHQKLCSFETMKWRELKQTSQNHYLDWDSLGHDARAAFESACRGDERESVFSLRLSGAKRVIGLLVAGEFWVMWWDPEHGFCPTSQ